MLAKAFDAEINSIIQDVHDRSQQNYLDMKITKPKPSNIKLGLLYLFLYSKSYSVEELRHICSAAGLIQIGLDIHDWVTNERLLTPSQIETRQLQVLAGDYFSSLYYRLLASLGDPETIRKIAESVRKINQQKVIFYQHKIEVDRSFEQWLLLYKEIDLGFFYGFLSTDDEVWMKLFDHFITLDILYNFPEIGRWPHRFIQNQVLTSLEKLKDCIKKIKNVEVVIELQKYLLQFENMSAPSLVAEEI